MSLENKSQSKRHAARQQVLAALDAGDAAVPSNPQNFQEADGGTTSGESFRELYNSAADQVQFRAGDVVTGRVVTVQEHHVVVDIGYKSEGLVPKNEFRMVAGQWNVESGQEVQVYIERVENESGMVVLSKDKADMLRAWDDISRAAENQDLVEGMVVSKVKGGLSVDIGVKAFLPGSQIDVRPVWDMDQYIGKTYKFKVIKFNKRRGNVVLSRRAILETERKNLRTQALDTLSEGSVVKGVVKNLTEYGAFVDLGGMDGLLHITDMSWGRFKHPSEKVTPGDEIEVKVLKFDPSKERISLGLKQMTEDPWEKAVNQYQKGQKVHGQVVSLVDYGAFLEIEEGVEGLVHVSEMSWTKRIKHPSQVMQIDDEVDAMVLGVDAENRRISLGLKQLEENPWNSLKETYPAGTVIEGEVKSVTEFGVFIGVRDGVDGLVHVSDLSWSDKDVKPATVCRKGDTVRAVVLGVDVENERFRLGIKQLKPDPWSVIEQTHPIGSQHEVKVVRLVDFGIFVELNENIEGLIHLSELSQKRVEKPDEVFKLGDQLKAEIISIDKPARKLALSAKLVALREQQADVSEHVQKSQAQSPKASLGDLLGDSLKEALDKKSEDKTPEKTPEKPTAEPPKEPEAAQKKLAQKEKEDNEQTEEQPKKSKQTKE